MRPGWFTCRALVALLFVVGLAAAASAQPGRVGGLVRDEDGQPIKGATITAENREVNSTFTATTDDRGRFTIIGLRSGLWRFVAQAPGYAAEAGELPIRAVGSLNPPITFALRRNAPEALGALSNISNEEIQRALGAADELFGQGKWDEAIASYRGVLARAPALAVVQLQIGAAYRGKQDFDAAIAAYQELLKVDENHAKAQLGIALAQVERGDVQAAEATLTSAASGTSDPAVPYQLAELKRERGDIQGAAAWYEKAAAVDRSWGKPLYQLGELARDQGDAASASKYMDQVIAVDPLSPEAALAKAALDQLNK